MRRSSGLLWVAVLGASVVVMAGCKGPEARPDVQVRVLKPEQATMTVYSDEARGGAMSLTVPGYIDLRGDRSYRVCLSDIPDMAKLRIWGELRVESVPEYTRFSPIPLDISRDDIEDAKSDVLVVKVVFLPDEKHQVYAIPGAPTSIVSTRLEPGKDAVKEAEKQGKVLLVLRIGGRQFAPPR